jgi:thymidylate synthase (FAD)
MQDTKNRQNSLECEDDFLNQEWEQKQQLVIDKSQEVYTWAINNGIAKEQARAVLPEGNTKSKMYVNGTLRSWIHYIDVRTSNGTQEEHKIVAINCALEISKVFPLICSLLRYVSLYQPPSGWGSISYFFTKSAAVIFYKLSYS